MHENDAHIGSLIEDTYVPLEKIAIACHVETDWLLKRIDEGLFPHLENVDGAWRFSSIALLRIRRVRQLERDFDALPELAALVADCLEELDGLRAQVSSLKWNKRREFE